MATATSLQQAVDNRGFPYYAVRPAGVAWTFAMSGVTAYVAGPFLATTKVVRVVAGLNDVIRVTIGALPGAIIMARGIHQDFIVYPGETISITLDPLSGSGNASVMELA
jgi:hypothetical protein